MLDNKSFFQSLIQGCAILCPYKKIAPQFFVISKDSKKCELQALRGIISYYCHIAFRLSRKRLNQIQIRCQVFNPFSFYNSDGTRRA